MIIVFLILSISLLGLTLVVFAEEVNYITNKPKWCNSVSLIDDFIFEEFLQQKEYKYPCATFI